MSKYLCEHCDWHGDDPATAHPEYEDGGYPVCPNGCVDTTGEPEGVVLDLADPDNQRNYARALRKL